MYGQSDKVVDCIIVMDFYACRAAMHTVGWHRLLAAPNCKVREAWNGPQCNRGKSHDEGRDGSVAGVCGSLTRAQNESVTGRMELQQVGTDV